MVVFLPPKKCWFGLPYVSKRKGKKIKRLKLKVSANEESVLVSVLWFSLHVFLKEPTCPSDSQKPPGILAPGTPKLKHIKSTGSNRPQLARSQTHANPIWSFKGPLRVILLKENENQMLSPRKRERRRQRNRQCGGQSGLHERCLPTVNPNKLKVLFGPITSFTEAIVFLFHYGFKAGRRGEL